MTLTQLRRKKAEYETPEITAVAPPSHAGILEIGGQYPYGWDTADQASVNKARAQFDCALGAGYVAQVYKPGVIGMGGTALDGEVTREFDPEADVIRMSLPYAGG
jgi:hypothetical protein